MKTTLILAGLLLLSGCSQMHSESTKPTNKQRASMNDQEMHAQWMKLGAPSESHQRLEPLVGKWKHTVEWRMDPKAKSEIMHGTNYNSWIMGKRFLVQNVVGADKQQPFEGLGILGFDNVRKEYTSVWLDSMGTGMMIGKGNYSAKNNSINEKGEFSCPMKNDGQRDFRSELKLIDNNRYTYSMFDKDQNGREFKSLEVKYERIK